MGLLGAVVGLVVGLIVYAPTAPFAVLELGIPATLVGGLVGFLAGGLVSFSRLLRRKGPHL
jgi:hypothetical protein